MEEIIYIDLYFAWNFVLDLVSLLVGHLASSRRPHFFRLVFASALGASFSVATLFIPHPLRLFSGCAIFYPMVLLSCGRGRAREKLVVGFFTFLTALFLGGAMEFLTFYVGREKGGVSLGILLAAVFLALGAWSLWGKALRRRLDTLVIPLSICHKGKREELYGLVDSGALLRSPDGRDVILLKAHEAGGLLTPEELDRIRFGQGEGLVSLPIRTASGEGNLYAFLPTAVYFYEKKKVKQSNQVLVALDFSCGAFGGCPVLVPLCAL